MICILPADQQLPQAAELACQLWPSHSREELHATLNITVRRSRQSGVARATCPD